MKTSRGALAVLAATCFFVAVPSSISVGAPSVQAGADPTAVRAPPLPVATANGAFAARHLMTGLSSDTDLLLLPRARRPAARPVVTAATLVAATPAAVASVFLNPTLLRQALPALVRADVVATRPGARPEGWPDRLIEWEVEVPLFNLGGKAWLQQRFDGAEWGAELTLVEGAFAPGRIRFRSANVATAAAPKSGTFLSCELQVEVRSANWIFRKVARHDPWAETAITAAITWVVTRAVGLRAEAAPGGVPARPRTPIVPPPATTLDGTPLGQPTLAALRAGGVVAAVRRAPTGRLAWASVAVQVPGAVGTVSSRLATPETWTAFPGWKSVRRKGADGGQPKLSSSPPSQAAVVAVVPAMPPVSSTVITVEDNIALVDLDADWAVDLTPPGRATAIAGDIRGAVFAWQTQPGDSPGTVTAVLSMHPRLDAAGFMERKLVVAEPLLEHALAVALTYVDAAAMADSFAGNAR